MKQFRRGLLALILALSLLLSGCNALALGDFFQQIGDILQSGMSVPFSQMEYSRPDSGAFLEQVEKTEKLSETETDVEKLMEEVYACYELYYSFYTNYVLANIHYCIDVTDIYWDEEYQHCLDATSQVDAAMDSLLYALADCGLRQELEKDDFFGEGFFSAYEGDSLWDEAFTALMDEEAELLAEYYDLSAEAGPHMAYSDAFFTQWGTKFIDLFTRLVALRQEIADCAGYDNYIGFAYDFYYDRDYTPEQAVSLIGDIQKELSPLYTQMPETVRYPGYAPCTEAQIFAYVKETAGAMGGTVGDAFRLLEENGLYNTAISNKKYDASFEVYLPNYYSPYVFLNPQGIAMDKLTFAHEFGHFCNDYAAGGTVAGVDVAEVFSQAMEYLSLCYNPQGGTLEPVKMADTLGLFVEQSAYACFEHRVYQLEGEEITAENVLAVYRQVGEEFGFAGDYWDSREFVMIPHFFTNPLYIISYVVSADAAMQIYQAELETKGAGLALMEQNLDTDQPLFLAFVEEAGLTSPFESGRAAALRDTLRAGIWGK